MNRVIDWLVERLGVFATRSSLLRVVAWTIGFVLLIGTVAAPHLPVYTDRDTPADEPPSQVRYVAPLVEADLAGFLPPAHDSNGFTVAWIGGSEVKLRGVSVPSEFAARVGAVGGKPLHIDTYSLLAMRIIDVYMAMRAAIDSDADAIVVVINPVATWGDWDVQQWPSLEVTDPAALWTRRTLGWAATLTSPADISWAALRAAVPTVAAQQRAYELLDARLQWLDPLDRPTAVAPPSPGHPGLPHDPTDFWLLHDRGGAALADFSARFQYLLDGIGADSAGLADGVISVLIDEAEASGKPVYFYITPVGPEVLDHPSIDAAMARVEHRLAQHQREITTPAVRLQPISLTRTMPELPPFFDVVHMVDAALMGDAMVRELCPFWSSVDPALTCSSTSGAPIP